MAKYVDIDVAKEAVRKAECDANWDERRFDAEFIENALDFILTTDVAPVVHGHWISKNPHGYEWTFVCSNCDYADGYPFNNRHNYCPNCGAKMDGETEDK